MIFTRPASSLPPIAATLLLHAALVAAAIIGLSSHQNKPIEPPVMVVQLLPPPVENVPPVPLPVAAPVAPAPPPQKPRPQPKRIIKPQPPAKTKPHEAVVTEPKTPDASFDQKPAASNITAIPAEPAAPPTPAPTPAPPARTGVSIPATYAASNRKPDYPALSRRYEEQGTVVLRVLVKADGTAGAVEIKSSSGYPLLDESARKTVQTWRFNPGTSDGKPIAEWYQLSIPFKLQD
jgi:protein TonB